MRQIICLRDVVAALPGLLPQYMRTCAGITDCPSSLPAAWPRSWLGSLRHAVLFGKNVHQCFDVNTSCDIAGAIAGDDSQVYHRYVRTGPRYVVVIVRYQEYKVKTFRKKRDSKTRVMIL